MRHTFFHKFFEMCGFGTPPLTLDQKDSLIAQDAQEELSLQAKPASLFSNCYTTLINVET